MKHINPEYANCLKEIANEGSYLKLLPMEITELSYGYCKVETKLSEKLNNPFGNTHGGVFASLIDVATYWATYAAIAEEKGITTIDLQMDNIGSSKAKQLVAKGQLIKLGKTLCLAEAIVTDENNKLLAHGKSKILIVSGLQLIQQAMENTGFNKSLPFKFL